MSLIATCDAPLTTPDWERVFELFPSELACAEAQVMMGRPQLSRPFYQKILESLGQGVNLSAVEAEFRAAYQEDQKHTAALNFFALLHLIHNDWEKAAASWKKSLAAYANQPDILYNLGCISASLWRLEDAIAAFIHLLQLEPEHVAASVRLARCYYNLGRIEEASGVLDEALAIAPAFPMALGMRIACHTTLGEKKEAAALARKALGTYPLKGEYFFFLTEVETLSLTDPMTQHAQRAWEDMSIPAQDRIQFGFGLYRVYEAAGEYERAFACLKSANELKHKHMEFDAGAVACNFATVKAFTPAPSELEGLPEKGDVTPVFIVGMPRSGTSLVEQILASHTQVHGAGELDYFQRLAYVEAFKLTGMPWPQCLPRLSELTPQTLAGLREYYLTRLRAHDGTAKYIVDKLPGNFLCVGLILALFPEAKIIHCKRDALATCFSIYRQHFVEVQNYAYDLGALATVWKEYDGLMRHWKELYGDAIHEVSYEALVGDPEGEARKLLEYAGLEWDDAVLRFYEHGRTRTASATQVTKPIYKSSLHSWKPYAKELEELKCQLSQL